MQHACDVAGDLTPEQWAEVVPEQEYDLGLPLGLTSSAALLRIPRVDPESTAVLEPPGCQPPPSLVSLETRSEATTTRRPE